MVLTKKRIIFFTTFTLVVIFIQVSVGVYFFYNVSFDGIDVLTIESFFLFLLFTVFNLFLRYIRWSYILPRNTMKRRYHILVYLSGFSLTLVPGRIGEMVRVIFLKRHGISYKTGAEATILDRGMDLIGISLILFTLLLSLFNRYSLLLIVIFVVFLIFFLCFLSKKVDFFSRYLGFYLSLLKINVVFYVFFFSLLAWLTQGLAFYFLVSGIVELGFFSAIKYYLVSLVAGAVSFIPGGIGIGELTIFSFLSSLNVETSLASLLAIIARGVPLWFAIFCGLFSALFLIIDWKKPVHRLVLKKLLSSLYR